MLRAGLGRHLDLQSQPELKGGTAHRSIRFLDFAAAVAVVVGRD